MITKNALSPFIDPAAVEAWDAWFRWREQGRLRDTTIDATWQRVGRALAKVLPAEERPDAEDSFRGAFAAWEILLDERVLSTAGTGMPYWPNDWLSAVVNVASFVRGMGGQSYLDLAGVRRAASLALKLTDLAAWVADANRQRVLHARIGIIGFGDALVLLRMNYGSAAALRLASQVAQALLVGATAGSIEQARRYGGLLSAGEGRSAEWMPELPPALRDVGNKVGLRHAMLTAIVPQPRLAMFANGVADGIDPAQQEPHERMMDAGQGKRIIRSPGYAQAVLSLHGMVAEWPSQTPGQLLSALRETAGVMQPWIDSPITTPLSYAESSVLSTFFRWPQPRREEIG